MHVALVAEGVPENEWPVEVFSQHRSCEKCSRGFEPLTPHNFSFNSTLGWCPTCEGLGTQVGANPVALLRSTHYTLEQGRLICGPIWNCRWPKRCCMP